MITDQSFHRVPFHTPVTHSRVEAMTCYKLVRVISRSLSCELPRVMLEKFRSCHTQVEAMGKGK